MSERHSQIEEMQVTEQGAQAAMLELAERAEKEPELRFLAEFQMLHPESTVYLVGGIVRDCAMGLPCKDFDFVIEGSNQSVVEDYLRGRGEIVAESDRTTAVYKFVPKGSKTSYDIALARVEEYDESSRKPQVKTEGISIEEDLSRRDFTINAMALPAFSEDAELVDPYGGVEDINRKLIRAVGEPKDRFFEDPLRMLRAIRFACRFGFKIEEATFDSIQNCASEINRQQSIGGKETRKVSNERLEAELSGALVAHPARFFDLMDESGLMSEVLPEVSALKGVPQPVIYHSEGDVSEHTRLALASLPGEVNAATAWATLLHDIGKPATFQSEEVTGDRIRFNGHPQKSRDLAIKIAERLHFKNDIKKEMSWLILNHMLLLGDFKNMKVSRKVRFVREPYFDDLVLLTIADAQASIPEHGEPNLSFVSGIQAVKDFIAQQIIEQKPPQIIDGTEVRELIAENWPEFDFRQGHGIYIKEILQSVDDAYYDGKIHNQAQAQEMVLKLIDDLRKK